MTPLATGVDFGGYRVVKLLGASGNVDVYLMRSAVDGALYAMKLFMPPDGITPDSRRRFAAAMAAAKAVQSENIVRLHDFGQDPDTGLFYMIMDFADGGSLDQYIALNGALDVAEALRTAVAALTALQAIHDAGLFHGDVTPGNILFMQDGTLKLADLGIAKVSPVVTADSSTSKGIPAYVAPEQVMQGSDVDARADIYSVGVALFEMLTGSRTDGYPSMLDMIVRATNGNLLPDVSSLRPAFPDSVASAVAKLCAPKPEDRPQTAAAAAELLRSALRDIGAAHDDAAAAHKANHTKKKIVLKKPRPHSVYDLPPSYVADAAGEERTGGIGRLVTVLILLLAIAAALVYGYSMMKARRQMTDAAAPSATPQGAMVAEEVTFRSSRAGQYTWYYTIENSKAVLCKGLDNVLGEPCIEPTPTGTLQIPTELDGVPVAAIGQFAFSDCRELTAIELPDSLESLDPRAFSNCTALEALALKSPRNPSYKSIDGALYSADAKRLVFYPPARREVALPDGLEEIGQFAFYHSRARHITIPASVKRIGQGAFMNCASLQRLDFIGDAPSLLQGDNHIFKDAAAHLNVHVKKGAAGWPNNAAKWPAGAGGTIVTEYAQLTREWRDLKGRTRSATLVGIAENNAVAILQNPGESRVRSLTIAKLCQQDRDAIAAIANQLRTYVKRGDRYQPAE